METPKSVTELDDGNIYRKLLELMVKTCKNHGFPADFPLIWW